MDGTNRTIIGIKEYLEYKPEFNLSMFYSGFLPFFYIIPTAIVMTRILIGYLKAKNTFSTVTMDGNIFSLIMLYFLFNILFFITDYLRLNLPSTGLITSWCATVQPNHYFKVLVICAFYCNFGVITLPFLVSLIRITIILSPRNNVRYCKWIMRRFCLPWLFLSPIVLTSINWTNLGYCEQMGEPYGLGAVWIATTNSGVFGLRNVPIHLTYSIIIFTLSCTCSSTMFIKLRMSTFSSTSARTKELSRKAENSLTLTMASSIVPFITNSTLSLTTLYYPHNLYYVVFLRPLGNDYETVMMPWILYLTHPLFRKKKLNGKTSDSVWTTTSRSSQMV